MNQLATNSGFFTPEDLKDMQRKLESQAPAHETEVEREQRALRIVNRHHRNVDQDERQ